MPESGRLQSLLPLSGRQASAQVWHAPQAQALGDLFESLPTGREEAAEATALAQVFQPRLPGLRAAPEPIEDRRHFARDRRLAIAE